MDIQLSMMIFQIVNFSIVMGALWYLLYKPVLKIFSERAKRIEEGQKAAAKAIAQQEKIQDLKAQTERELKEKTSEILKKATEEAKQQQDAILAEAKTKADAMIDKMRSQFEEDWKANVRSQEQSLVASVFAICEKVLPESLSAKQQSALVDQEIARLIKQL